LFLKTLGMLCLHLSLFGIALFAAFSAPFGGLGWEAIIKSPLGERAEVVAQSVAAQLNAAPYSKWNEVLHAQGDLYNVRFSVYDIGLHRLAGDRSPMPTELVTLLERIGPPPRVRQLLLRDGLGIDPPPPDLGPPPPDMGPPPPPPPPPQPPGLGPKHHRHHAEWEVGVMPELRYLSEIGLSSDLGLDIQGERHLPPDLGPIPGPGEQSQNNRDRILIRTMHPQKYWIATKAMIKEPFGEIMMPAVILASCDDLWHTSILIDLPFYTMMALVVLGLSILFWMPFVHSIEKAISQLTYATEKIADGKFDIRIGSKRNDELGALANAVDAMAARLANLIGGQRRFLGDIAHELRSPMARLQMALELLVETDESEARDRLVQDIRQEVSEMNQLVDELLAYSKASLKGRDQKLVEIELEPFMEALCAKLSAKFAREDHSRCKITIPPGLTVMADELLLERALSNVIRNSFRYAPETQAVEIEAKARSKNTVALSISDRGPGVPAEALENLGEPFFRPEASRSRSLGGVGLGLAIVKTCVEAMGGAVEMQNNVGGGFRVTVVLNSP
jgi:two-component system, OmpR family, sensor histidine kinase CpxA